MQKKASSYYLLVKKVRRSANSAAHELGQGLYSFSFSVPVHWTGHWSDTCPISCPMHKSIGHKPNSFGILMGYALIARLCWFKDP